MSTDNAAMTLVIAPLIPDSRAEVVEFGYQRVSVDFDHRLQAIAAHEISGRKNRGQGEGIRRFHIRDGEEPYATAHPPWGRILLSVRNYRAYVLEANRVPTI